MNLKDLTHFFNEVVGQRSLTKSDVKVISSFYNKKSMSGTNLSTDGKKLEIEGLGGEVIARWSGGKIEVVLKDKSSKFQHMVLSYLQKDIPVNVWVKSPKDLKLI